MWPEWLPFKEKVIEKHSLAVWCCGYHCKLIAGRSWVQIPPLPIVWYQPCDRLFQDWMNEDYINQMPKIVKVNIIWRSVLKPRQNLVTEKYERIKTTHCLLIKDVLSNVNGERWYYGQRDMSPLKLYQLIRLGFSHSQAQMGRKLTLDFYPYAVN